MSGQMTSQPIRLFHVSDLHFGQENRVAIEWFAREVEECKPDHIICTGDLTMRGNGHEFAAAKQWLTSLAAPVSLEIGNHDVPYYWYLAARIMHPYRRFRRLNREIGVRPDLPGLGLTGLRTVAAFQLRLNLSKGHVAKADLDTALASVASQADKPLRIVACHHPLVDGHTQSKGSTRNGRAALTALAAAGADIVLSGHVHDPFDMALELGGKPVRLIGAGTLSQRLRGCAPSYNQLMIDGTTVTVKERRFGADPQPIPAEVLPPETVPPQTLLAG